MSPNYVPALIAGTVAIAIALLSPAFTAAADRRLRKREVLAKAVGALAAYREYPYVIRRRDGNDPAAERQRITGEIMSVQRELTQSGSGPKPLPSMASTSPLSMPTAESPAP